MAKSVIDQKKILPLLVMFGSFIAVRFFNVNVIVIIVVCGLIGALTTIQHKKLPRKVKQK